MRYLFGFMCVCALGIVPLAGCEDLVSIPCEDVGDCEGLSCSEGQELFCDLMEASPPGVCDCSAAACISTGVTCSCTPQTNSNIGCNRVHVDNINNQPGIEVVLISDTQTCTIDELIVNTGSGIELDQCLMNIGIGEDVEIVPEVAGMLWPGATCRVNDVANVPGLEELQTFASVFDDAFATVVGCDTGFTMQLP